MLAICGSRELASAFMQESHLDRTPHLNLDPIPVYLFPEDQVNPHYLGRIRSAFVDDQGVSDGTPQHNIEVNRCAIASAGIIHKYTAMV